MPTINDEIAINIYSIDTELFDGLNHTQIIDEIINGHQSKVNSNDSLTDENKRGESFSVQNLRDDIDTNGYIVKVFYSYKYRTPKWKHFIESVVDESEDIIQAQNKESSYIVFFSKNHNLFAISGGQGNFLIQDCISQTLGFDIISRVINVDSEVIKQLQDRGLTGTTLGTTKFFRGDIKFSDDDNFGKLYKTVAAVLDLRVLRDEFGFTEDEVKKPASCIAKSSFRINKSISFTKLLEVLDRLSIILSRTSSTALKINKTQQLNPRNRGDKELIDQLLTKLITDIYSSDRSQKSKYDFCAREYDKYLTSQQIRFFKGSSHTPVCEVLGSSDLNQVLKVLEENDAVSISSFGEFYESLKAIKVVSFDESDMILTRGNFIKHIHGEITFEGQTYFYLDGSWHLIQEDFITELNSMCIKTIVPCLDGNILPKNWVGTEDEYICSYFDEPNTFVLHKVTSSNIELCDLIIFNTDEVNLIHIKKGFDNSIRDLVNQMSISAKAIQNSKARNNEFLKDIHLKMRQSSSNSYRAMVSQQQIGLDDFINLFNKKINICAAIFDSSTTQRSFEHPESFDSNIAKFSLINTYREIKGLDYNFKLIQIS